MTTDSVGAYMHEGGCSCGFVRYRMAAPIFVNACHCRMCQRESGSAFAINAMIEVGWVELTGEGAPETFDATAATPPGAGSARCPRCGVRLWDRHRLMGDNILFIRAGTLDQPELLRPDAHFFVSRKHPWIALPADARSFAELPGENEPPLWSEQAQTRIALAQAGPHG